MIFWKLFYTFCKIGIFNFGGGYAMIALIQNEVVEKYHWLTAEEFTDLLAVSQMTPGPVGINTATYAGYTAVVNAGYPQWAGVCGSLLASFAVIIIPVALVMLVGGWLLKHKDEPRMAVVMKVIRLAVVGLVAAAALGLMGVESFGVAGLNKRFVVSVLIFAAAFVALWRYKVSPVYIILASGIAGLVAFSV